MPWYTELKEDKPYIPKTDIGIKLIPKKRYRVIKVNGHVDIHSITGLGYLFTMTPEKAREVFKPPYWIEFDPTYALDN